MSGAGRRLVVPLLAIAIVAVLYLMAREPSASESERLALASRFQFSATALPAMPGTPARTLRHVHPSLERISAWISSVGAAVALADIDGDGLPNDACYVDTRSDRVMIAPVPGSGGRYAPFALDFAGFPFDSSMAPMGCLPGNFKEDQWTDLVVYFWGRTPVIFLHTATATAGALGPGSFVAQELVPGGARWFTNAATSADIDGDGHTDLVFGNYFPTGSRILGPDDASTQPMQHSMSAALNGGGPELLRWAGATAGSSPTVRFVDVSEAVPADARHGWTLAVAAADLDGRLLPGLYLANDFGPDRLLYNQSRPGQPAFKLVYGRRTWTTPKSKTLGRDSFKGMGVDVADLERRGLPDIFVSNITEPYALEESNFAFLNTDDPGAYGRGVAPFTDRSEALGLARSGWAWDVKLGDFDNSGSLQVIQAEGFVRGSDNRWPELQELAMANDQLLHTPLAWPRVQPGDDLSGHDRDRFFVLDRNGVYVDVGEEVGVAAASARAPSRGIATADSFGDGRLDFAVANQWGDTLFFRNRSRSNNQFLGLHLRLPIAGRSSAFTVLPGHPPATLLTRVAVGASAVVSLPGGGVRLSQVDGGNGHSGKRSPDLQFGLGPVADTTPLRVALRWRDPDGTPKGRLIDLTPGWYTVILGKEDSP